jgi:type I restriction enzyme S subunit
MPQDWETSPVKYATRMNAEVLSETTKPDFEFDYLDIGNVSDEGQVLGVERMRFDAAPSRARRVLNTCDVLISTVRTYLKAVAHAPKVTSPLVCSTGFAVLTPRTNLDSRFLFYWARSSFFVGEVVGRSTGVSYPAINPSDLGQLPVPAIPFEQQRRIAAFLDAKLGRLDELMRKKERQLALLAEKRQALISHAVTRGLNPNAPTKHSGIEWLGNIPAHWDVKRLKYVAASVQTGSTPPTSEARLFSEDGVKWFTPGDFSPDGRLTDSARYVSEAAVVEGFVERFSAPVILIVSIGATLGKIGLSEDDCCCNQQINAVRIRQPNSSYYFCHLLTVLAKFMMASANQATLPIFNQTQARNLPVLAPPPEEQATIVAWLDGQLTRMARTADLVARQLTKLHEYRQSLITAAVTGQVAIPEEAA